MTLDCGHEPSPTDIGTGYGTSFLTRKTFCYDCAGEVSRQEFCDAKYGDDPIFAYISDLELAVAGVHPDSSRSIQIIDWPGNVMGKGYITRATHGLGGRMHGVVATIEGRTWHGRYYPQAGTYTRLRLYKNQDPS